MAVRLKFGRGELLEGKVAAYSKYIISILPLKPRFNMADYHTEFSYESPQSES